MAEGLDFLIPSLLFMKGALIDNQRSSFYKCGISCRPISHWKGSPRGIS